MNLTGRDSTATLTSFKRTTEHFYLYSSGLGYWVWGKIEVFSYIYFICKSISMISMLYAYATEEWRFAPTRQTDDTSMPTMCIFIQIIKL